MDGNVFSSSLATLGQWLLNNPQGTGLRSDSTQASPGMAPTMGMPTGVPAGWQGGQPGQPQNQLAFPQEQFAQPNLPGAQAAPKPAAPEGGGGGGGGQPQRPYAPQGGGGSILNTAQDPDPDIPALQAAGYDTSGMGGAAGAGQRPGGAIGSALSGISSALSSAGKSIAGVNTMPSIVQGGAIPGINQQPMSLVGRRPQPRYI